MSDKEMRELDAWIAEHVMGLPPAFVVVKRGLYYRPGDKGYTNKMSEAGRYTLAEAKEREYPRPETKAILSAWDEPVTFKPWECDHYTTDPAAALTVLEKCAEKNRILDAIHIGKCKDGWWQVHSYDESSPALEIHHHIGDAVTLPLAICLFARQLFGKSSV